MSLCHHPKGWAICAAPRAWTMIPFYWVSKWPDPPLTASSGGSTIWQAYSTFIPPVPYK